MDGFSHLRILVVEDDAETASQIADSLTTQAYDVDIASSGKEALERGLAATVEWYRTHPEWVQHVKSGEYQNDYARNYEQRAQELGGIARIEARP